MSEFRVHLIVEDETGPNESGGLALETPGGKKLATGAKRLRVACNGDIQLSETERATGEPWAVKCLDCRETEAYAKVWRPKPPSLTNMPKTKSVMVDNSIPPAKRKA